MVETTDITILMLEKGWTDPKVYDRVRRIIAEQGMEASALNLANIGFIEQQLSKSGGQRMDLGAMVDGSILDSKYIVRIRDSRVRKEVYFLHNAEQLTGESLQSEQGRDRFYTFDDLISALTDVDVPVVETSSRPKRPEPKPSGLNVEGKGDAPTPRKPYGARIHASLFDYLIDRRHELAERLYADPQGDGTEIKHNTKLLKTVMAEEMYAALVQQGWDLNLFSLIEFMGVTVKQRSRRVTREVRDYLRSDKSAFLDNFDYKTLNDLPHVSQVIEWLRQNNFDQVHNEMGFYASCLRSYLHSNSSVTIPKLVLDDWVAHAHDYERLRHSRFEQGLPAEGTTETYINTLTAKLLEEREQYQTGDIIHLFQGLRAMGRVTNVNDEKTSRMQLNLSLGVANYLIANVDMIDTVMENTYERIKQGQLAEDNIKSHKAIYTAIQNGTFSLNDDNLDAFKRSLDKQFSKDEKDMFTRMRSRTIQSIDPTYREDIVRLYLVTKGPQFVAAQK